MNLGIYNLVCALIGSQHPHRKAAAENVEDIAERVFKHLEHTHYVQQSYEYYYITKIRKLKGFLLLVVCGRSF